MNSHNNFQVENIKIGVGTIIEPTVVIRGINGKAKNIVIGDHCYIGHNVQIICDEFEIGDYSKIQHDCNIHGYKPCKIGHNLWMGQFSIIDSIGGCEIGNNCGIGAHSQLWSHIKYGDKLEGCKFSMEKQMKIGNDVWFVGHCIVSPIIAEDKSMAMVGSVITKNMEYNRIYAGSPAVSISEKIGFQFDNISIDEKYERMLKLIKEWKGDSSKIVILKEEIDEQEEMDITYFYINNRTYTKRNTDAEISFMKFLLPDNAKFIPKY